MSAAEMIDARWCDLSNFAHLQRPWGTAPPRQPKIHLREDASNAASEPVWDRRGGRAAMKSSDRVANGLDTLGDQRQAGV